MSRLPSAVLLGAGGLFLIACNGSVPEPASADIPTTALRVTIVRTATDLFLQRFNLTMTVTGPGGCSTTTELFPDTGYAGRRNIYLASQNTVYVVGQYDARVIDSQNCRTTLSEFRHLDRDVVFVGSFDQNNQRQWVYFSAAQRPELPFERR
ncbi:MAG: hypothetical protein RML93_04240 [Anaerolineales bacterium]|nr:hypothetical protein [Anaerolineales bacterium]MDW8446487.1 hypothetical protein [Anaerolineales bacterium]